MTATPPAESAADPTRYAGDESQQEIIQDILQGSPGMSLDTASTFADTAISVFCPDGVVDNP